MSTPAQSPLSSALLSSLLHLSRAGEWAEQLQELINAKPETHPTDCVSRATKQQPDRFVSVGARFENLMDRKKGKEKGKEGTVL